MDKEDAVSMYVYIYSILYIYKISNIRHKKNEIMSFAATWMDLAIIMLWEATQKKQINDIAYMWNPKKKDTNELIYKTERDSQTQKTNS